MLASFPAGTVNQKIADLGILNDSKHFHPALSVALPVLRIYGDGCGQLRSSIEHPHPGLETRR
ncbi:hypothetical protein EOA23_32540 [Mesorhizobium sp. M2A.F.Ca.ET.042.01.1.1]|nr:hypothetical protein EOA23_32540 [Mesorhizobium sp. M2A.F.Ca.ET.042.01.1.1]